MIDMSATIVTNVHQGEYRISNLRCEVLVTVLGSCIATCLYDPVRGVGGMNHFLLPGDSAGATTHQRFGLHAMELLINGLLREGAARNRLKAKVFGGAQMMDEFGEIGRANARFALDFLMAENVPCMAQSVLGDQARRLRFWPASGRAQQLLVPRQDLEELPMRPTLPAGPDSSFELF